MWDLIVSVPDHCLSFYFSNCFVISSIRSGINIKAINSLQFMC